MEKYQVNDEPTLIRETPNLQDHFRKNRQDSKITQSSAELGTFEKNKKKSFYQDLYPIEESVIHEGDDHRNLIRNNINKNQFRLRQIEEDPSEQIYIKKLYSKTNPVEQYQQNGHMGNNKKSLKGNEVRGLTGHHNQGRQERSVTKSIPQQGVMITRDGTHPSTLASDNDRQHRLNFMIGKLNI